MNPLIRLVIRQFGHPSGFLGELAGWVMATRESNLKRNEWTIDLLQLSETDRVLEIGPGPGVTLNKALEIVTKGKIVALDHSDTMLNQCRKRNIDAIRSGRLELIEGDYNQVKEIKEKFSKIFAVNSLQFSGIKNDVLKHLLFLLETRGVLAVTFQPRGVNPTNEDATNFARTVSEKLLGVGFSEVHIELLKMKPVNAICILAKK